MWPERSLTIMAIIESHCPASLKPLRIMHLICITLSTRQCIQEIRIPRFQSCFVMLSSDDMGFPPIPLQPCTLNP
ncbi:hypothetical protein NC652_039780 [Populus alba x Populus x berolinensis]|nr:hypothetical protein NC652_039780 [Populus alba x Populus x berolinensis]